MSGLGRVAATDVVRSFGAKVDEATPLSIKHWLEKHYLISSGGGFGYDPAINGLVDALQGVRTFEAAREKVSVSGRACGRPYNVAVFDALEDFAKSHEGQAHRLKYVAVKIGSHLGVDVHVGLKVPMVRVHRGSPRLVVPAFRNSFLPTWEQAGLECSIATAFLAQNDFYGVDKFEYLCVRSEKSALDRECTVFTENDLPLKTPDEVDRLLTAYFQAVCLLLDEGKGLKKSSLAGYKVVDPSAPGAGGLFG